MNERFSHKNIINFIDSCQQDFQLWIKSEYLGTLMRNF